MQVGTAFAERSSRLLGYFSVGLGTIQIVAPELIAEAMGLRRGRRVSTWILRGFGMREMAAGMAILGQRRPSQWLWARIAGDAVDITFAASGLLSSENRRGRVLATLVLLTGITALDMQTAEQLDGAGMAGNGRMLRGITVNRPQAVVEDFWRTFSNSASVSPELRDAQFGAAPGGRGTEIRVDEPLPTFGIPTALSRIAGKSPQQRVQADLRRAKQLLETGEVTVSDATRDGAGLFQPAGEPHPEYATATGGRA